VIVLGLKVKSAKKKNTHATSQNVETGCFWLGQQAYLQGDLNGLVENVSDGLEVCLLEPTRRERRRTQTHTACM
jgi:hypothetical protein